MLKRNKQRLLGVLALILAAGTLAGCGCGPFGFDRCGGGRGGYGGERGGYGGGYDGPHGGGGYH